MNVKMKTTQADAGCGSHRVRLELTRPDAHEVGIAGSFNDWHPSVTPMIRNDGKWAKELDLPPGRYEYRFVVDGEWMDDPEATDLIPNLFGTANAVLVVAAINSSSSSVTRRPVLAPQSLANVGRVSPAVKPRVTDASILAATLFRRAALA